MAEEERSSDSNSDAITTSREERLRSALRILRQGEQTVDNVQNHQIFQRVSPENPQVINYIPF